MHTHTVDRLSKHAIAATQRDCNNDVRLIILQDGRRLAYQEYGDRRGFPLFHCHSHGSSRLEASLFDAAAKKAGFRLVSIDRPGTGFSDFDQTSNPNAFANDLLALANILGFRTFGLMASGGGAAYALAACHAFPERAQLMLGVSCIPPKPVGFLSNISGFPVRLVTELMRLYIALRHRLCAKDPLHYLERLSDTLCFSDRRLLQNPRLLEAMNKDIEESMRQGARGVAHDISMSYVNWGFDPGNITIPVLLWRGSADTLVSQQCAKKFANTIPNSSLHRVPNRGHFFFLRSMEEVFSAANSQLKSNRESKSLLFPSRVDKSSESPLIRAAI
ncbi:MAG: alpha/beta hydrolase [Gammaproteobacteria bacterium]|nr:alpha/beta hydrolase [Gammaproteobacteria bacterium]MDP2349237.1 alpha/beta hydrolase [Gammaproteobacteria bacterium]